MMKSLHIILLAFFSASVVFGQMSINQHLPFEIKQAYKNGTRSPSGYPGTNYWQNHAKYEIDVRLLLGENLLKGEEKVSYYNNSPDTLDRLVIRLYPNIYKKGNPREWPMGPEGENEGVIIDWLLINGDSIDLDNRQEANLFATNLTVILPEPLSPGDSLLMETRWKFEISERTLRMGNYGNNRYFIAYWYPQIAVYDDIDGWDRVEYLGMVEYYNDFNEFDVKISTPPGYVVWATGELLNERDMFSDYVLKNLMTARLTNYITRIFSAEDFKKRNKIIRLDGINAFHTNIWHFKASQVPDFSFAVTRDVNWDGSSIMVDSSTRRRVFVDAVYADSARTYQQSAEWARASVEYMSFKWPGIPFPYPHMTTVSNDARGGGMESPMMANNGDPESAPDAALTIFHEIAHSYFPFYLGTNERKYAWMDEGWAAFLPLGFSKEYFPDYPYDTRSISAFENINGKERESTLMTLSYSIGDYDSYRSHAYVRPALAYYFLQDALGDSLFKLALHEYMHRWNGKHPLPYDFFNTFNSVTGKDLGWFFNPWFYELAYADLGIKKVTNDNKIVIQNYGGLPLPVVVTCEFADGSTEVVRRKTSVWSSGNPAVIVHVDSNKMIRKVVLGTDLIPDIDEMNNVLEPEN
ncbi:MAG: M1 family metallopeptidase [Bacteroidetes bacterium]|nr:M1 family metallopeptidase [Bacteroidota bacterium]